MSARASAWTLGVLLWICCVLFMPGVSARDVVLVSMAVALVAVIALLFASYWHTRPRRA